MKWRFTLSNTIQGDLILSDEPIGWADVQLNIKRDMVWHGVFFEYAINLSFYEEGYDYINEVYNAQGINAYVELYIEYECEDNEGFQEFYVGKLVLAKCLFDCKDDRIAQVPVEQAGALMKFKNRIDQKVNLNSDIDFDGDPLPAYDRLPFVIDLLPKAIILRTIAGSEAQNCLLDQNSVGQLVGSGNPADVVEINSDMYLQIPIKNMLINELNYNEEDNAYFAFFSGVPDNETAPYTGSYEFTINLEYIEFSVAAVMDFGGQIAFGSADGNFQNLTAQIVLYINGSTVATADICNIAGDCSGCPPFAKVVKVANTVLNTTHFLNAGDTVKIIVQFRCQGFYHRKLIDDNGIFFSYNAGGPYTDPFDPQIIANSTIKLTQLTPISQCNVYAINESLSRVCESVTAQEMRVRSDYFGRTDSQPYASDADGCGSLEVITKGLLIRQFQSTMPVSFQEMFNALNAIHNIGMGAEPNIIDGKDWIRVEPMEYFYDPTIILECDGVPEIKKRVMPEWYPSVIEIGYDKWETESSMGLDEFATKRQYRTRLSEIKNTASQICSFIASGYSIEVTRNKEYVADSTIDWRLDNDVFIICVKRDADDPTILTVEQGQDCADVAFMTNIIDPNTIYNYRISPMRNLMRWIKAYMGAYFSNVDGVQAKFIFTSGDGNTLVSGDLITGCVNEAFAIGENEFLDSSKFADPSYSYPLFRFETDEFEYPLSIAGFQLIRDNSKGTIKYRRLSTDSWSEGFIFTIAYKPNDGIATFTVLPKFTK